MLFGRARHLPGIPIAAVGGVQDQGVAALLDVQGADVGQGGSLGVTHVLQQRAGGADSKWQLVRAEAPEVERAELIRQEP